MNQTVTASFDIRNSPWIDQLYKQVYAVAADIDKFCRHPTISSIETSSPISNWHGIRALPLLVGIPPKSLKGAELTRINMGIGSGGNLLLMPLRHTNRVLANSHERARYGYSFVKIVDVENCGEWRIL